MATLLTAPFLHPHYLVILLIPAAFLFDRLSPAAIAIPLARVAAGPVLPLAVLAVLALLLLPAVDRRPGMLPECAPSPRRRYVRLPLPGPVVWEHCAMLLPLPVTSGQPPTIAA